MNAESPLKQQLDSLLQQEISPEQFYRQYLELLSKTLSGSRGFHLWAVQGGQFIPLGGSDLGPIHHGSDQAQQDFILLMLRECATAQKSLFIGLEGGNRCPFTLAFTPLLHGRGGGAVQGAQVSWWQIPAGQSLSPQLADLLDECGRAAAKMARLQKLESMSQIADRLQLMTRFLDEVASAPDLPGLSVAIVNRAREITGCDRCALVAVKPGFRMVLKAISNVPFPDPHSAVARTLLQLAENARNAGLPAAYRKASEKTEEKGDLSDYFYHSRMEEAVVFGIQLPQQDIHGMLIFESMKTGAFDKEAGQTGSALAVHSAGPLRRAMDYDMLPALPVLKSIVTWRSLPREAKRATLRRYAWIPALILLAVLFFPVKYEFAGDGRLMPSQRALAIAEAPGRLLEILVADGARVRASQPIARLDDSEQRKQMEIASQEEAKLRAESDRLQGESDSVAARISQLNYERARKEREYYEAQLARATILSPIDGIVMAPGLASRQGDAMVFGSQLAMIGNPDSWELEIHVPEADIAEILATIGQGKKIPVRFILNAFPEKRFSTVLDSSSAVSAVSEVVGGKNLFLLIVRVPRDAVGDLDFRAGFTGRAKLQIGYRPLSAVATRRFFNWIRTNVLF